MLVPLTTERRRRGAFTLLEVLVVVAILVVLASVAGIAVFNYLDRAKEDKARMDMKTLVTVYNGEVARSGGELTPDQLDPMRHLVPNLERGSESLKDPWGQMYQWKPIGSDNGQVRIQFYTTNPKTNEVIFWPLN